MGEKKLVVEENERLHIEDVMQITSCSKRHLMEEIRKKKLKCVKPGNDPGLALTMGMK